MGYYKSTVTFDDSETTDEEEFTADNDEEYLENLIIEAEHCGILVDRREEMPKGKGRWPTHPLEDVLGCCIHQNGSVNTIDPTKTARYHTSADNHITPGRAMPSICYDFAITDTQEPAWLVANPLDRKYEQGSSKHPGDENRHLLSILVMGSFSAPGYSGYSPGPSLQQLRHLEVLVHWCKDAFNFQDSGIFGHFDFGKAACPGSALVDWIETRRLDVQSLETAEDWQKALMDWNPNCLPKYGVDGDWGEESKFALSSFQRWAGIKPTAFQDVFTELMLLHTAAKARKV